MGRLAIFDHDGVLVDSLALHEQSWYELGRRENLPLTAEFVHATFGQTNASILRQLLGQQLDAAELARYSDIKEVCYREIAQGRLELMAGVRDLLDALRYAGFQLAIGSSGPRLNLELTVSECGLDGYFATIVSVEDIRHGKPDPEVFLTAAGRVGSAAWECVVFEDAPVGIQAARAAGMYAVGVGTTHPLARLEEAGAHEAHATLEGLIVPRLGERMRQCGLA